MTFGHFSCKLLAIIALFSLGACKKDDTSTVVPNYTNFKITKVTVNIYPDLDPNNNDWDIGGYPDVYFNMEDVNNNVLYDGSSNTYSDVVAPPIFWNLISAYNITNTSVTQYVTVYDKDAIATDELMGYVGFRMDDYKTGYQTSITKSYNGLTVTINGVWY
jgi:hypothetical protein